MAIHAQKTTFRSSAQFPDFAVTSPLDNGQVLIYDENKRAFVNKPQSQLTGVPSGSGGGGGGGGGLNSAINLGLGADVFKQIVVDELEFRTISGGPGITVDEDGYAIDEITIVNDIITDACISVPDSFKLEIDNDNNTLDTARFEIFSFRPAAILDLTPITNSFANFDIEVVTDITFTNPGQFISSTANFISLGYAVGMCIEVTGTTEQDGIWEIASITTTTNPNDTITITIPFPDATDAGQQPPTTIDGVFWNILTNQSVQSRNSDFVALGFVPGQTITIHGTTDNDGTYTIASITTTTTTNDTINILETFPGTLGCDVGDITLSAPVQTLSVGWWVNELGEMKAQDTQICGDLDVEGDVSIGGDLTVNGHDLTDIVVNLLPIFPETGLIAQIGTDVFVGREIFGTNGINVADGDGILGDPTISADDFDITINGDISGSSTVAGLSDTTITLTLPTITVAGTYNSVTVNAKGQVVSGASLPLDFQPMSPQLDDLSDGMDNPGFVVWAGSNYTDRIIIGTTNEIVITDGDGVAGDPIIGIVDNPIIPGNESIRVPRGFTAQRPGLPVEGMFRYNQTDDRFEGYHDASWEQFAHLNDLGDFLPLTGGTLTGDLTLNGANIVMTGSETVDGRDVGDDGAVIDAINTGTGIKVQTGAGTFVNRSITVEANSGLTITNPDGVAADPELGVDITTIPDLVGAVDVNNDYLVLHDDSSGTTTKITPNQLVRPAFRYFFAQI